MRKVLHRERFIVPAIGNKQVYFNALMLELDKI